MNGVHINNFLVTRIRRIDRARTSGRDIYGVKTFPGYYLIHFCCTSCFQQHTPPIFKDQTALGIVSTMLSLHFYTTVPESCRGDEGPGKSHQEARWRGGRRQEDDDVLRTRRAS